MSDYMLHLMSPARFDDVGAIVGDRQALQDLRDALNEALATGSGGSFVFHSDGEPYTLVIALVKDMANVQTAYAAEINPTRSARETIPIRSVPHFLDGYHKALMGREAPQADTRAARPLTSVMR